MLRFFVLLVLLAAAPCAPYSYAQRTAVGQPEIPRDLVTGMVSYRRVVVAEDFSREQLYCRARKWVAQNNHSPAGTAPIEDKQEWKIVAHGEDLIPMQGNATAVVGHTLTFYFKQGKFQYEFSDFNAPLFGNFENDNPAGSKRAWNRLRTNTDIQVKAWVSSLERDMMAKTKDTSDF